MVQALIKKSGIISEQAKERYLEELTTSFQRDIALFEEYVEKLNLYDGLTIDDWEEDRGRIAIGMYLSKCKTMLEKGFAVETAKRLLKLMDDTCIWSTEKLSPVLTEYARKLDAINEDLRTKIDSQQEEIDGHKEILDEAREYLEELKEIVETTTDPEELKDRMRNYVLEVFVKGVEFDREADAEEEIEEVIEEKPKKKKKKVKKKDEDLFDPKKMQMEIK